MVDLGQKIVILSSARDLAGKNIRDYLREHYFKEEIGKFQDAPIYTYKEFALVEVKGELISLEGLEKLLQPKGWVFASRHSSKAGINSLTVHTSGNWGEAKFGGKPNEICVSNPVGMKNCLLAMKEAHLEGFAVSMEVTHHGPSDLRIPSFWAEIGSSRDAWSDKEAGKVVAEAILKSNSLEWRKRAVGFGGTHYAPAFSRVELGTDFAIGHVMPKHGNFSSEMIKQAFEKTPGAKYIILDWKGLTKPQKEAIAIANQSYNFETLRSYKL